MKKYITTILSIFCILSLIGCSKKESHKIEILVPTGSAEEFVYSDEEIRPMGNRIKISSGAGLGDTEVILKPVNENVETGYVATYLTRGMPVEFDTRNVNDEWFKIGVSVQNDSDKGPIAVSVEIEGVEVKIAEKTEVTFHDKTFNKSDLSEETIEWIENYNSLSEEEQLAISYIPADLYELCGYPTAEDMEVTETITYNGKEYLKSELCNATLKWLELSVEERMLSSYFPPEFMIFEDIWGITLTAENITSTSVTIKCTQTAGNPIGELQTGSWYILEQWTQESGWKEMPYIIDGELGWTAEAWMIPMNDTCEWEVEWEWLYGTLPEGKYRIGKSIMDFRDSSDFDTATYYAEFNIN